MQKKREEEEMLRIHVIFFIQLCSSNFPNMCNVGESRGLNRFFFPFTFNLRAGLSRFRNYTEHN